MENLRETLRDVIHEELKPMREQLGRMEDRLEHMEDRLEHMDGRIGRIEIQLDRIEHAQNEDVIAMLHMIDKKVSEPIDQNQRQINVLNTRMLAVEADILKLQSN